MAKGCRCLKNVNALRDLGYCYHEGYLLAQDYELAAKYYQLAAEIGDNRSQWNLGLCYIYGEGVQESKKMARYWIAEAASNGFQKAIDYLKNEKDYFSD